jgi:hypothetical protein
LRPRQRTTETWSSTARSVDELRHFCTVSVTNVATSRRTSRRFGQLETKFRFRSDSCYGSAMDRSKLTIRSGGQTGADRAALDAAIELGLPHCGWCPRGRKAEDGRTASVYNLTETGTALYRERTRLNVRDSDGTVIFSRLPLRGGTGLTAFFCRLLRKPLVVIEPGNSIERAAVQLRKFIKAHHIRMLNVAGPRASTDRGIYAFTNSVLVAAFAAPNRRDLFPAIQR